MRLKVGLVDDVRSDDSMQLIAAIRDEPSLRIHTGQLDSEESLRRAVLLGEVDAGLHIRGGLTSAGDRVLPSSSSPMSGVPWPVRSWPATYSG